MVLPCVLNRNGEGYDMSNSVFDKCLKALEPVVQRGVRCQSHHALVLSHPARYAFTHFHPEQIQIRTWISVCLIKAVTEALKEPPNPKVDFIDQTACRIYPESRACRAPR